MNKNELLYKEIRVKTDLRENSLLDVLKIIPHYNSKLIMMYLEATHQLNELISTYETMYKERLDFYINDNSFDIFQNLKSKEDREIYIRNSDSKLKQKQDEINMKKEEVLFIENLRQYMKDLSFNVNMIIQYEKFRHGVD